MSAQEAKQKGIRVYELEAVENNPQRYGVTEDFLKNYPGDYLYKVPTKTEIVDSKTIPSPEFISRNRDFLKEHAPKYLNK